MVTPPRRLADGEVTGAGDVTIAVVPLDGATRARLRFKTSVAGTLKFRYLHPDMQTEYVADNPADAATLANTEDSTDFATLFGEAALKIIFNSAAGGTVNFADWSAVAEA